MITCIKIDNHEYLKLMSVGSWQKYLFLQKWGTRGQNGREIGLSWSQLGTQSKELKIPLYRLVLLKGSWIPKPNSAKNQSFSKSGYRELWMLKSKYWQVLGNMGPTISCLVPEERSQGLYNDPIHCNLPHVVNKIWLYFCPYISLLIARNGENTIQFEKSTNSRSWQYVVKRYDWESARTS